MIVLRNICVHFDGRTIFHDEKFEAYDGQLTVVKGESGSGKSTLYRMITFERETQNYEIDGVQCNELNAIEDLKLYTIGSMPQFPMFIEELTVKDHLHYFVKKDEFVNKVMKIFQVELLYNKHPHELSGGEKQILSFIIALSKHPKILVCDEPTASLDKDTKEKMIQLLKEYSSNGNTVIVMSHDSFMIEKSDCLYEINNGHLLKEKHSQKKDYILDHNGKIKLKIPFSFWIKMKKYKKIKNCGILVVVSLAIAFVCFSLTYGNIAKKEIENELKSIDNTIFIYKETIPNDFSFYQGYEMPFTYKEIQNVKDINGVDKIWAFINGNSSDYYQLKEGQPPRIFSVYQQGTKVNEFVFDNEDSYESYHEATYNADYVRVQNPIVKKQLNNQNGVYITESLLEMMGLKEKDINEDTEIEFPIRVPQYHIMESVQYFSSDGTTMAYGNMTSIDIQYVRLKVSGILSSGQFEVSLYSFSGNDNIIYYPLEIAEKYMEQLKVNDELITESGYKAMPFHPSYYILTMKEARDYDHIVEELDKMGIAYVSQYVNYASALDNIQHTNQQFIYMSLGVLVLMSMIYYMIKINQKKLDQKFIMFFKNYGFSSKMIRSLLNERLVFQMIVEIVLSFIFYFMIMSIVNGMVLTKTVFTIQGSMIVVGLSIGIEVLLECLIYINKGKRAYD